MKGKDSVIMHYAKMIWRQVWDDMCTGACSEEEVRDTLMRFNPQITDLGLIDPKLYVSYDKAMAKLGIGNRNKLHSLAKKHGIECKRVNNVPIGFHVNDIGRLKMILDEANKKGRRS